MSTAREHYAAAESLINRAEDADMASHYTSNLIALAQVRATLALAVVQSSVAGLMPPLGAMWDDDPD